MRCNQSQFVQACYCTATISINHFHVSKKHFLIVVITLHYDLMCVGACNNLLQLATENLMFGDD